MIILFTGKLGTGKTYDAVRLIWKFLDQGKDCYANIKINFDDYYAWKNKGIRGIIRRFWRKYIKIAKPMGKLYYWSDLSQLYKIRNGEVFFDEAHMAINARDFAKLPRDFVTKLTMSRKYGLNLYFISQHSQQIDITVRRLANSMITHKRFTWIFYWQEYDGELIEVLANPQMVEISRPKAMSFGLYLFSKKLAKSYDTYALYEPFDEFNDKPMWEEKLSTEKVSYPQEEIDKRLIQLKSRATIERTNKRSQSPLPVKIRTVKVRTMAKTL